MAGCLRPALVALVCLCAAKIVLQPRGFVAPTRSATHTHDLRPGSDRPPAQQPQLTVPVQLEVPIARPATSKSPDPVGRLHATLEGLQGFPAGPDACSGRRFLVLQYEHEQDINGFGAIFQYFAAAFALAERYNRTLVELLPPAVPPEQLDAAAGGGLSGRPPKRKPARSRAPGSSSPMRAYLRSPSLLRWHAVNDPWRRAPLLACGGAKMGCFFRPHTPCALAIAPGGSSLAATARAAPAAASARGGAGGGGGGGGSGGVERVIRHPDDIPLLGVEAEEARRAVHLLEATGAPAGDVYTGPLPRLTEEEEYAAKLAQRTAAAGGIPTGSVVYFGGAEDAVVRIDAIGRYRGIFQHATGGAAAPGWFTQEAAAWLCGDCADAQQRMGSDSVGALRSAARCRAFCGAVQAVTANGGGDSSIVVSAAPTSFGRGAPWQQLWFPALQSFLFRPLPAVGYWADGLLHGREMLVQQRSGSTNRTPLPLRVGIHYRRGDAALLKWRSQANFTEYLHAGGRLLPVLHKQAGAPPGSFIDAQLYLATDSISTRVEAEQLVASHQQPPTGSHRAFAWSNVATTSALLLSTLNIGLDAATGQPTSDRVASDLSSGRGAKDLQVHTESWISRLTDMMQHGHTTLSAASTGNGGASAAGKDGGAPVHWSETAYDRHAAASLSRISGYSGLYLHRPVVADAGSGGFVAAHPSLAALHSWSAVCDPASPQARDADDDEQGGALPWWVACRDEVWVQEQDTKAVQAAVAIANFTAGVVRDIDMLAGTDVLLGTCLSQVSRTAYEVGVARGSIVARAHCPDAPQCTTFPAHAYSVPLAWEDWTTAVP